MRLRHANGVLKIPEVCPGVVLTIRVNFCLEEECCSSLSFKKSRIRSNYLLMNKKQRKTFTIPTDRAFPKAFVPL